MSKDKSKYYCEGWNAFIDGKGCDDNPWTMTGDKGQDWEEGNDDAYNHLEQHGSDGLVPKVWSEQ